MYFSSIINLYNSKNLVYHQGRGLLHIHCQKKAYYAGNERNMIRKNMNRYIKNIIAAAMILCLLLSGCQKTDPAGGEPTGTVQDDGTGENNGQNGSGEQNGTGEGSAEADTEQDNEQITIIDDSYRNYYEIFVYSFYDSDGDGYGDLNGVTQKLDYVADMGYTGIWFMPVHPSPTYHKYDITDYYGIDQKYGTLDDMKNLIKEAHSRNIDIILDLVVNHTSSMHPWFREACAEIAKNGEPSGQYKDYYVFQPKYDNGYTKVGSTEWYYEARFWSGMPDLNLDNPQVREEIKNIMKYWFDLGVDGFRLDACTSYYTGNVEKNKEFLNWLSTTAHGLKQDCFLVGEAWENADPLIRDYFNSGLDSFFIFTAATGEGSIVTGPLSFSSKSCGLKMNDLLLRLQSTYNIGIPSMFLGNHDTARAANFLRKSMPDRVKMAAGILAMMPGALFTYYGEEIGMLGTGDDPNKRIAMLWDGLDSTGYCTKTPDGIKVNADSYYFDSVEKQKTDQNSILNYYRKAMRLRNKNPEIARGTVSVLNGLAGVTAGDQVSVTKRSWNGSDIIVVMNLNSVDEEKVVLDKSILGYEKKTGELLGNTLTSISANDETGEYVLAPYSVIILR